MEPKVSIIMPTYKRIDMLDRAIRSIEKQTYRNWELIVVDDNPSESEFRNVTENKMKKYQTNPKIKYVKRDVNGGGALARNTGIEHSIGEYIAFLDDDDEFIETKLEKQIATFQDNKDSNVAIVTCQMLVVNENGDFLNIHENSIEEDSLKTHLKKGLGFTGTLMIKREAIEKVNGFSDVPALQEYILILKILGSGYRAVNVPEPLYKLYEHTGERITNGSRKIEGIKVAYQMKKEHFYILSENEKKEIEALYYKSLIEPYLALNNKEKAIKNFKKMVKISGIKKEDLRYIILIIFGYQRGLNLLKISKRFIKR